MNINEWTDHVCETLEVDVPPDLGSVLRTARDVSHTVARPAAPVTTFLIGYAAAKRGGSPEDIDEVTKVIEQLVAEWPQDSEPQDSDSRDSDD